MTKLNSLPICLVATAFCMHAGAANTVLLQTPVIYHPNAGVVQQVREECKIEDMLSTRVSGVLARRNRGGDGKLAVGAEAKNTDVLKLTITHVLGVGGGAWSGPKAITVDAELLDGDKVLRRQKMNRWSVGGVWGAFKGTCTILDRVAVRLAKDLGRWSFEPNFKPPEDEPAPTTEDAGRAAAPQVEASEVQSPSQ